MDDSKNSKKTKPKTEEEPALKDPVFSLERLRQNCFAVFGVTTSTFDGATCGLGGAFTVNEIKEKIEAWQNTQVFQNNKKKEVD